MKFDISGSVNRYNPGETSFHVFGIYPYLFLELIVYELRKYDESFDYITEDEIEFFIKFSRNMDELPCPKHKKRISTSVLT